MKKRKSLFAKIVTLYLKCTTKRKSNVSKESEIKRLNKIKRQGEKEYNIPKFVTFHSTLEKTTYNGMVVYTLNGKSKVKKTIFYFHGGGYINQPLSFHWRFVDKLSTKSDAKIIFPLYPLAPFHNFRETYNLLFNLYSDYIKHNTDEEIIFMGDSSGGGLALGLYANLIENKIKTPDKTIVLSPWVDIATDNSEMKRYQKKEARLIISTVQVWGEFWAAKSEHKNYMVSPLYYSKLNKLKNVSVFVGTDEILYPDIIEFYNKLSPKNNCKLIVEEGMNHVYPLYPIKEAKASLNIILDII